MELIYIPWVYILKGMCNCGSDKQRILDRWYEMVIIIFGLLIVFKRMEECMIWSWIMGLALVRVQEMDIYRELGLYYSVARSLKT